jgi:hypothetical protein
MRGIALDGVPVVDYETTEKCGKCGTTLLDGTTQETCAWCAAQERIAPPTTHYNAYSGASFTWAPMVSTHVPVLTVHFNMTPTVSAEPTLDQLLATCPVFRPTDSTLGICKCGNARVVHSRLQIESWQASLSMTMDNHGRRTW